MMKQQSLFDHWHSHNLYCLSDDTPNLNRCITEQDNRVSISITVALGKANDKERICPGQVRKSAAALPVITPIYTIFYCARRRCFNNNLPI
jgi:hypothetical protein